MDHSFSLKEQTGQMIVAGFDGVTLAPQIEELIRDCRIGGVILFGRNYENPAQLRRLVRDLQDLALSHPPHLPLFVSVDQEGGRVSRLKTPFADFPPMCCLGEARSEELAYRFGKALARELTAVGINMDYAPVLDVHTNPQNPIIGDRALSDRPEWVARLGSAIIRAFQEDGIVPVGKHFPGHGDTALDSHLELPYVDRSAAELEATELYPFARTVRDGLEVVMTAHVVYRAWDENHPATFSKKILQGILREKLGFDGVIVSDDLEMKAIENHFPFESLASLGIGAGIDLFLICNNPGKVRPFQEQMVRALENGGLDAGRASQSVQRIVKLKKRLAPAPSDAPDFQSWAQSHQKLADEMRAFLKR